MHALRLSTDRGYRFPFAPDELWSRLSQVEDFPAWWPWLREFDGDGLLAGQVWQCTVQPPLPYAVRFSVTIDEVSARRSVAATIDGDIIGTATLHIEPDAPGCRVRLISDLAPRTQWLQAMSRFARPVIRLGHDWVLDTAAHQFVTRSGPVRDDGLQHAGPPRRPGRHGPTASVYRPRR